MRARTAIAVFVLAPIAAAVLITVLLLAGVSPHLVFLPGHAVKAAFHAHNRVGVLATELFWWALIVIIGLAVQRLRRT